MDFEFQEPTRKARLVIDTNYFLHKLAFVVELLASIKQLPICVYIPAVVVQELDTHKTRNGKTRGDAQRAIAFIHDNINSYNSRIICEPSDLDKNSCVINDDLILRACVSTQSQNWVPFLLSNDKNLCIKAKSCGVHSFYDIQEPPSALIKSVDYIMNGSNANTFFGKRKQDHSYSNTMHTMDSLYLELKDLLETGMSPIITYLFKVHYGRDWEYKFKTPLKLQMNGSLIKLVDVLHIFQDHRYTALEGCLPDWKYGNIQRAINILTQKDTPTMTKFEELLDYLEPLLDCASKAKMHQEGYDIRKELQRIRLCLRSLSSSASLHTNHTPTLDSPTSPEEMDIDVQSIRYNRINLDTYYRESMETIRIMLQKLFETLTERFVIPTSPHDTLSSIFKSFTNNKLKLLHHFSESDLNELNFLTRFSEEYERFLKYDIGQHTLGDLEKFLKECDSLLNNLKIFGLEDLLRDGRHHLKTLKSSM